MKRLVLAFIFALGPLPTVAPGASGDLDRSYGAGGFAYSTNGDSSATMAIQQDDKVITGGQCLVAARKHFCVTRYLSNGEVDTSFGSGGRVATAIGAGDSIIRKVVVLPDGKILAVGYLDLDPAQPWGFHSYQFAITRYTSNGGLDPTFDGDGIVTNPIMGGLGTIAWDVAVQPDGKFVVAGSGQISQTSFVAVRFNVDGCFDPSFAA